MGFKARDRASRKSSDDEQASGSSKEGQEPCGVNGCEGWSDASMGGRSISVNDAEDMWGKGFTVRKNRVRVCKSCYRSWKKSNKQDDQHYG
jgi:hypothetical protein